MSTIKNIQKLACDVCKIHIEKNVPRLLKISEIQTSDILKKGLWTIKPKHIHKTFHFETFTHAFDFMKDVAKVAEKEQHHPEWCNVYNKVDVSLTTHSSNGISEKDLHLAQNMDSLYSKYSS